MTRFQMFRRLFWLLLVVALSQGCTSVVDSGVTLEGLGFASDTTAIIFYEHWETTSSPSFGFGGGSGMRHLDWELMLVDVRFHKVYWKSRIDRSRRNAQILRGRQWSDSTMLVVLSDEYWLWTVGNKNPQKIDFDWQTEQKNYVAGGLSWFRPWKNDFFLLFSYDFGSSPAILDTRTMTVNAWEPGEDAWIADCHDVWWEEEVGWMCLMRDKNSCRLSLLSGSGDTLGGVTYAHECKEFYVEFYRYFIRASLGQCNSPYESCYTYPTAVEKWESSAAMFRYDKSGNIAQKPSFWMYRGEESRYLKFVDSLGNVTRY
jgi:hypothetical protein